MDFPQLQFSEPEIKGFICCQFSGLLTQTAMDGSVWRSGSRGSLLFFGGS